MRGIAALQRKIEEAKAFMDSVNRSKLGIDWKDQTAASADPGQLAQRNVGEGMMIGEPLAPIYKTRLPQGRPAVSPF